MVLRAPFLIGLREIIIMVIHGGVTIASGSTRIENSTGLTLNNTATEIQPAVNAGRDLVQIKDSKTTLLYMAAQKD